VERGGDAPVAERAAPGPLARVVGELKVTEPPTTQKQLYSGLLSPGLEKVDTVAAGFQPV